MKLLLARHGETEWNAQGRIQGSTDVPLNDRGRAQAEALGRRLLTAGEQIDKLYTSPRQRALETARIAGRCLGLEPVVLPGVEEVAFGAWEGHTWAEVREQWPDLCAAYRHDRYRHRPPEGESYEELLARVLPALRAVEHMGKGTALVVCHGGVMRALFSHRDGMPCDEEINDRYPIDNAEWAPL